MSSPQQSPDRKLSAATDKLSLTSHQAAHAVLSTNELLCGIIAHLSVTGVCKSWRSALKEDPNIQEALFLKPAEVREVWCDNLSLNDPEHSISIYDDCMIIGKLHPRVEFILGDVSVGYEFRWHPTEFSKIEHPDGTWRDMFITQPPCQKVQVSFGGWFAMKHLTFERGTGVTFGELYDFVHSNAPNHVAKGRDLAGFITICGYENEENMPPEKSFPGRCQVRAGEVCRPTELPLPVASSDTSSCDDSSSSDDDNDKYGDVDENWDRNLI